MWPAAWLVGGSCGFGISDVFLSGSLRSETGIIDYSPGIP
jgi:hypothetical protein